jgi:hypothetical protein
MRKKWIFFAPLAIVGLLVFVAIGGEIVMRLWNWLLPAIFGWHQITFWQALGMLLLCRILFGGVGGRGYRSSNIRGRMRERIAERAGQRTAERWDRMTPEERERFRQGMSGRCGFGPSTSESKGQ